MHWMFGVARRPAPAGLPAPDQIREHLRAAVDADEQALSRSSQAYAARVESMIADFFARYGGRDAHP